jgi:hypothetical protein
MFALVSATGHAAEEGAGGDRAKEPPRLVEPKKKQDTDAKGESNGKPGIDKAAAEEKTKPADEK